jgi:hypothetical protein
MSYEITKSYQGQVYLEQESAHLKLSEDRIGRGEFLIGLTGVLGYSKLRCSLKRAQLGSYTFFQFYLFSHLTFG